MRPHRRQFVVGPEPFRPYEDWSCEQLGTGSWLSRCPALRYASARDADGRPWTLLGLAVETFERRPDPLEQIAAAHTGEVPGAYASWAGRWVLIGAGRLHMDASGRLGCLYGRSAAGASWASSSPALLADLLAGEVPLPVDPRTLRYEVGISWYTPPRSRIAGMRRLLASQVLELEGGALAPRALIAEPPPTADYRELIDLFRGSLLTALSRLPADRERWLGLTAGADSRLLLAVARSAGVELTLFTRVVRRMSAPDRALPPKIARDAGYRHVFLRGQKPIPGRAELVAEHCAGHVSPGDAQPFLSGVRDPLEGIAISTNGFSLATGFAGLRRLPRELADPQAGAHQLADLWREPRDSTATEGLREWLEWVRENPEDGLDWRDRFFVEQRMGGWQSAKEQVYDLARLERFPILNSARTNAILVAIGQSAPQDRSFQEDLIAELAPELLRHPVNPRNREFGIARVVAVKSRDDPLYVAREVVGRLRRLPRAWGAGRG